MNAVQFETLLAVLVFALCVAIVVAPVTMTNFILRYRAAEDGDLYLELAYPVIAMVAGESRCSYGLGIYGSWRICNGDVHD